MEAPEKFETAGQSQVAELQEELSSLRTLLSVALILIVVTCGCVNIYLFKQVSGANGQAAVLKAQVDNFSQAKMNEFWNAFLNYAKTHQDYVPVIAKYADPNVLSQTVLTPNSAAPKR